MLAVIRLRGNVNVSKKVKDTLDMLNLRKVNSCVLVPDEPSWKGMLKKVENWVTWGEASREMEEKLGKGGGKVFRLHPPSRGLRSVKLHFPKGDLGYRGEKINELLKRMV
jgi:large subunit ribosomal protein L30